MIISAKLHKSAAARLLPVLILTLLCVVDATAQGSRNRQSFDEFRKGILSGYQDFRKTILDHYADFLNGEWHEYESLNGERRDASPKPSVVPSVSPEKVRRPSSKPSPAVPSQSSPAVPSQPSRGEQGQNAGESGKPSSTATPAASGAQRDVEEIYFFNLPVAFPKIDFNIAHRLSSTSDYAGQWKDLARSVSPRLVEAFKDNASQLGLNDYLTFQLVKSYVDSRFPQADESSRMSAIHYFLANLGYDARIAMTGRGVPLLLLPFKQTIYARNYMMMPDGKYYIFAPEGFDMSRMAADGVRTCTLPGDAPKGKKFDLVLGELKIPMKARPFDFNYGPIHISGEVNENLMPILYRYPQMPIGDYAISEVDPALRRNLVSQVKGQLKGMDSDQAVGELLSFMHNVFEYATDEEQHGFEKPYFLEETLFYPKNDCEDRAIFYTYFLWNALGKEAQLISFPGHEAATVLLDNPVEGTAYDYNGQKFYISDPTFIGSKTGMVMPIYDKAAPKIDYTYQ